MLHDHREELERRAELLRRLRAPGGFDKLPSIKAYYRTNPIAFINDWGVTFDPRNVERGLPALVPLRLYDIQRDACEWLLERWRGGEGGLVEKSRDMGASVTFMSLLCTLAIFERGFVAGVGSRKEMLVDRLGDPNTLFWKARLFLEHLPWEFRAGWKQSNKEHNTYMLLKIPQSGGVILGEAGDNIGRGGRTSIYLVDESAFLKNQMAVEAALSQTTRCRIDASSINGSDNLFAQKRHSGRVSVFTMPWRSDPRKDAAWYDRECARLPAVVVAQEIDIDYHSSKEGVLIPQQWVQAAIDAPIEAGTPIGALDVADEGRDKNAWCARGGNCLLHLEQWTGKASDIFATSERAALLCDQWAVNKMYGDADGLGAGVRGDMRIINASDARAAAQIDYVEYRGSGTVVDPDAFAIAPDHKHGHNGRTNKDMFNNRKVQSWWALRARFERTYQRKVQGLDVPLTDCISIPGKLPELIQLCRELSQVTYSIATNGKIAVDKAPDGMPSPNLADAVVIAFAPQERKRKGILGF